METRTFQADSVLAALMQAQREMGVDAMIVSVRQTLTGPAWQVWKKPKYEVVATTDPRIVKKWKKTGNGSADRQTSPVADQMEEASAMEPAPEPQPLLEGEAQGAASFARIADMYIRKAGAEPAAAAPNLPEPTPVQLPQPAPQASPLDALFPRMDALAEVAEKLSRSTIPTVAEPRQDEVVKPAAAKAEPKTVPLQKPSGKTAPLSEPMQKIRKRLLDQGVLEEIVNRTLDQSSTMLNPEILRDPARCLGYVKKQMVALVKEQSKLLTAVPNRVMCLVGASGSGKTSSVAKLAAYYSQNLGKRVAWISADTVRTGAIAESRMFAESLGIALRFAYTPDELIAHINAEPDVDMILIDTPGFSSCREAQVAELGAYLTRLPKRLTYMVAAATMKENDLMRSYDALTPFGVRGLIITKLDETMTFGNVFNFAAKTQIPLAYFSTGRRILGDMEPAEADTLVSFLFDEGWVR